MPQKINTAIHMITNIIEDAETTIEGELDETKSRQRRLTLEKLLSKPSNWIVTYNDKKYVHETLTPEHIKGETDKWHWYIKATLNKRI